MELNEKKKKHCPKHFFAIVAINKEKVFYLILVLVFIVTLIIDRTLTTILLLLDFTILAGYSAVKTMINIIRDVKIILHGKCYIGTCTGFRVKHRHRKDVRVEWITDDDKKKVRFFNSNDIRSKYPFSCKVYCVNNNSRKANLGLHTIIPEIVLILICLTLVLYFAHYTIMVFYRLFL